MAAYAALVSLMYIIEQIEHHPRPPISLDKFQVESLTKNVTFLQEFLEGYSLHHVGYSNEADGLESRIADAAYAAEDVIESHIVDQILAKSTTHGEEISSIDFYQNLENVIEHMDLIKKEVVEIKEKMRAQDQPQSDSSISAAAFGSASTGQKNTMVGCDDVLLEILDKLTGGQSHRQIIPIVGMGGIGKTTLAKNIYQNQLVVKHFDILVWVTISQEYRMREVVLELLQEGGGNLSQMDEYELGDKLHKKLSGRRYLIIIDDIWNVEVWDHLKFLFPDNNKGSRIMITTRLSNLASQVADSPGINMAFLDENNSWDLFSKIVFGEEDCPLELEEIGKKIVKNCRGLPLSIVVIGGLLEKFKHTREYWEYVVENLNSVVNSEDDERCLKILHMSYNQLPVYLKPCFLYMGVFSEDNVIRVSTLVKLWVAEGFLKPSSGKSMELVAKEYLKDLIDRNLILVYKMGSTGNIKYCNIHDLVRELCLREVKKERFYTFTRQRSLNLPQGTNNQRRIVIPNGTSNEEALDALQSMPQARSLICHIMGVLPSVNFKLLRILKTRDMVSSHSQDVYSLENIFHLFNSRYLAVRVLPNSIFPSSVCLLWSLHTLNVDTQWGLTAPAEIWKMPQLRHVNFKDWLSLPESLPSVYVDVQDDIVLENLQTLKTIINFQCHGEMVKRIPNIKKLKIYYKDVADSFPHLLDQLDCLQKLESFRCVCFPTRPNFLKYLTFPCSLKKLTLYANQHVHWEDLSEKIGSLPLLEKLRLIGGSFRGGKWETVEGQFCSLKFLEINECFDLEFWMTESSHFPLLEHLVLGLLLSLKEVPAEIGEIPTLKSILLEFCNNSTIISAKRILEEQEELNGEACFHVRALVGGRKRELESLASPNFQIK